MPSPVGRLWIALGPSGIVRLDGGVDELAFVIALESLKKPVIHDPDAIAVSIGQLSEYFAGARRAFSLSVDLAYLRPFQRAVLEQVSRIPYGEVQSYGEVARAIGRPGAGRAVGAAVAASPIGIVVPCHRVVYSGGTPGEHAAVRRMLLALEGYRG